MTQIVTNEFCHVCLEFTKSLRDLLKTDDETLELIKKLKICVAEVNWSENGRLLFCEKCVRKLNKAHDFKRKCIESAETIKRYKLNLAEKKTTKKVVVQVQEPKNNDVEPLVLQYLNLKKGGRNGKQEEKPKPQNVMPAVTQIFLHQNNNQRLQNVVLNVLPATGPTDSKTVQPIIGIPQILQIPALNIIQAPQKLLQKDQDVTSLLKNDKTEEMSIEIDPLDFDMDEKASMMEKNEEDLSNNYTNEEKMEFFNSGHFLSSSDAFEKFSSSFYCERCCIFFDNLPQLHHHIVDMHKSQYPYRCEDCFLDFTTKDTYQLHLSARHLNDSKDSITLLDFKGHAHSSRVVNDVNQASGPSLLRQQLEEQELIESIQTAAGGGGGGAATGGGGDDVAKCTECLKVFTTTAGMMRHKSKMHKNFKRKTFFVKGEKNAQCDICGRYFSTHSYMTLHRKLHDRKIGWKRRIFKQEEKNELLNEPSSDELYFEPQSDIEAADDEDNDLKTIRLDNVSHFLKKTFQQTKELSMIGENG